MPETMSQPDALAQGRTALRQLAALQKNYLLYPAHHSQPRLTLRNLRGTLDSFFAWNTALSFDFFERIFIFQETPLIDESLHCSTFASLCDQHGVGSITIYPGFSEEELHTFLSLMTRKKAELERRDGLASILREEEISTIVVTDATDRREEEDDSGRKKRAKKVYSSIRDTLSDIENKVKSEGSVDISLARKNVNLLLSEILQNEQAIMALTAIKDYDICTSHHSVNVCILSLLVGSKILKQFNDLNNLGASALLHDIGKIRVPKEIINKTAPLTEDEWELIKKHPTQGAKILKELSGIDKLAMVVAFEHHAGFNLAGYPRIQDKKIPHIFSRIVQIADVYEASTSSMRSYSAHPLPPDVIIQKMYAERAKCFDAQILKVFITAIGIYPIGSIVQLNTGEKAVVRKKNDKDLLRPVLKVFTNDQGKWCEAYVLDLAEANNCRISIVKSELPNELKIKGDALVDLTLD